MKHSLALTLAAIILSLFLFSPVAAAEELVITTVVPDTHSVTVSVGSGGSVSVCGVSYTGTQELEIKRQTATQYRIVPGAGYTLDKVTYNGNDVKSRVINGVFTADELVHDASLVVTFKQVPGTGPKTGDEQLPGLWLALLLLSGTAAAALVPKIKKLR